MTNPTFTSIIAVIDRSGSMHGLEADTIGGFNKFLDEQGTLAGKCQVTLVQFDDKYEINYANVDVRTAPRLTNETYVPRGSTALFDAVGKAVVSAGEHFAAMREDERPGKVIVLIITDGMENASREYNAASLKELVDRQVAEYSWEFVFLGANLDDARSYGAALGFTTNANYTSTSAGTQVAYAAVSSSLLAARSGATRGVVLDDADLAV